MKVMTTFPDPDYLTQLLGTLRTKNEAELSELEQILMQSGGRLNWIADYLLDPTVAWTKEERSVDSLVLTGTSPDWNKIAIDQAERSPAKLRELMKDTSIKATFVSAEWHEAPILARLEGDEARVLDGMHRVIAAIRDNRKTVQCYVGRLTSSPKPVCEAHVVYDVLRAYQRGITKDRSGLVATLRYLNGSYSNVAQVLTERFGPEQLSGDDLQKAIQEALTTNS